MIEVRKSWGILKLFDKNETVETFLPLRDRIFDMSGGGVSFKKDRIFLQDGWVSVLIRGGLFYSDRLQIPDGAWRDDSWLLEWVKDDLRDPLHPLFEKLVEDGVQELIHTSISYRPKYPETGAIVTPPTRTAVDGAFVARAETCGSSVSRLLFDQSARWGIYADFDDLAILGGEPTFMERYIARAGGMEFIRKKADLYFGKTYNNWKFPTVPHAYKLAGWDNPPTPLPVDDDDDYWRSA